MDDRAGLEGDRLGAVGHGPLPGDDVEHVIPVLMAVRFDLVLHRDSAYGIGGFLDQGIVNLIGICAEAAREVGR